MSLRPHTSTLTLAVVAAVSIAGALARASHRAQVEKAARSRAAAVPEPSRKDRYATSNTCRSCHPGAFASWHRTFHRTMTQEATPDTAQWCAPPMRPDCGDDGRSLDPAGNYRVGRTGQTLWLELPGEDGTAKRRPAVLLTGSHHMQVVWTQAGEDGRLEAFPWAWIIDEARWVPNEATLLRPPQPGAVDGLRPPVVYTWNRVCIKCHVVAGIPGWDPSAQQVRSEIAELGIACEACHGPAVEHVQRHRNPLRRYLGHLDAQPADDIVDPRRLEADASSQICGQCHSITLFRDDEAWTRVGHDRAPPDPIASWGVVVRHPLRAHDASSDGEAAFVDEVLADEPDFFAQRFWSDGMVRVSGREYNGLIESPCFEGGELSCLTCHSMHDAPPDDQLAPTARTDAVCRQCHPSIAAEGSAHTHHERDSSGNDCYACHMPHTTYGLLKAIRSHEIDSPSVETTVQTGRPLACNLCHLDRTLAWSAEHLRAWYDHPGPEALQLDDGGPAAAVRWLIAGDAGQRAIAAWHFGWEPALQASGRHWQAPTLATLLDDPYAAVRHIAGRSLRALPGFARFEDDPAATPAQRSGVVERVRRAWRASSRELEDVDPRSVLVMDDGGWDFATADALSRSRDERPVVLAE